jgi:TonB family protein
MIALHLWQSTLCAVVAALFALALRRASARTRHAIWLIASLKFLVPLAAFVSAGQALGAWLPMAALPAPGAFPWLDRSLALWRLDVTGTPATASSATAAPVLALATVWIAGALWLAGRRLLEWRRLTAIVRHASPLTSGREADALGRAIDRHPRAARVRLVQHESRIEPGVLGIVRPTLVWPAGLSDRLSDAELDAVMTHETCHIERRDNLAALAQVAVETVFWFHPMVWWIGARLVDERERACDEEVLEMGTDNRSYAEGIVKVCGFCLRVPAAFVAGVGGAGLSDRVEAILTCRTASAGAWARALPLALALVTVVIPIAVGAASMGPGAGQKEENVQKPGNGVTYPRLVREVKPNYTRAAMDAKIQGAVWLEAVVLEDGTVGTVRVTKSLDTEHGLDEEAVKAMKQWTFKPGTKDDKPVPVQIEVEMTFRLK